MITFVNLDGFIINVNNISYYRDATITSPAIGELVRTYIQFLDGDYTHVDMSVDQVSSAITQVFSG